MTGGENGLTFRQPAAVDPGLFSVRLHPDDLHWFVLAVVTVSYLLLRRITQSPFGMVLQSIRENEPRTRAIGYHVERYKIVAVMLSGLFAGLAGVLYAIQNKFAAPDFVFFVISGEVVIFNVMGGMGTLVGPFAGAAFFLLLREGALALPHRVLPDPGGHHLHHHGHLPAPGPARLPAPPAQRLTVAPASQGWPATAGRVLRGRRSRRPRIPRAADGTLRVERACGRNKVATKKGCSGISTILISPSEPTPLTRRPHASNCNR